MIFLQSRLPGGSRNNISYAATAHDNLTFFAMRAPFDFKIYAEQSIPFQVSKRETTFSRFLHSQSCFTSTSSKYYLRRRSDSVFQEVNSSESS